MRSERTNRMPKCSKLVVGLATLALLLTTLSVPASAQDDDYDPSTDARIVTLEATYEVRPESEDMLVTEIIQIQNVRRNSGGYSYFWTGHTVWVPADAIGVTVESNGAELETELVDSNDVIRVLGVDFPTNLNFGQSRTLDVTYTLPSYGADASGERRINEAIFSIEVITCCDFEGVDLSVIVPNGFLVSPPTNFEFERSSEGGNTVYRFSEDEFESGEFTDFVVTEWTGSDASGLAETTIPFGTNTITVISLPDDQRFINEAALLLRPLSAELLTLTQSGGPGQNFTFEQVGGTDIPEGGWQGQGDASLALSSNFNARDIALTLTWPLVEEVGFDDPGYTQGLVYNYAAAALTNAGTTWNPTPPSGEISTAEDWFWFSRQITDQVGFDGLEEIAQIAASTESVYEAGVPAEGPVTLGADWRRFIDVAEMRMGMNGITQLFEQVPGADVAQIAERAQTLQRLEALNQASGLDAPVGVREAISNWRFAEANAMMETAEQTLAEIDTARREADRSGFDLDVDIAQAWTTATSPGDISSISGDFTTQADVADEIAVREAQLVAERGFVENMGFDEAAASGLLDDARDSFDRGNMAEAESAMREFDDLVASAPGSGRNKLITMIGIPFAAVCLLLGGLLIRRRGRSPNVVAPVAAAVSPTPDPAFAAVPGTPAAEPLPPTLADAPPPPAIPADAPPPPAVVHPVAAIPADAPPPPAVVHPVAAIPADAPPPPVADEPVVDLADDETILNLIDDKTADKDSWTF